MTSEVGPAPAAVPLMVRLRSLRPALAPSEERVAALVLESPSAASALTISKLAARAQTSETSVLRFARRLGFGGYPELRLALAEAGAVRGERPARSGDIAADDTPDEIVAKISHAETAAIEETAQALDRGALAAAATAIAGAGRVDLFGVGASGLVALDLQHKLHRIGRLSHVTSDVHLALTSATLLGPGDVALVISHSGTTTEGIEVLDEAAGHGATGIALTNVAGSPLARGAQHVLCTAAEETPLRSGAMASRIAALMVVDCLFLAIAQKHFERAVAAVGTTRRAVARHHRSPR